MTDRQQWVSGTPNFGSWTQEQADQIDLARNLLASLVSVYSARIAAAGDGPQREDLLAAQARYARERRLLSLNDVDELNRIVRDYPALLRELRDGGDR